MQQSAQIEEDREETGLELETKVTKVFTITKKTYTRAFSWLKVHFHI